MRIHNLAFLLLGLAACGSAPEPTGEPQIYTGLAAHREVAPQEASESRPSADANPSFAAPAGDVAVPMAATIPVTSPTEVAAESSTESALELVPDQPVALGDSTPPEVTVEFLDSLVNQIHLDIRWGRRDEARDRIAEVLGRVELGNGDSRSGIVTRLRALDGFLASREAERADQSTDR